MDHFGSSLLDQIRLMLEEVVLVDVEDGGFDVLLVIYE